MEEDRIDYSTYTTPEERLDEIIEIFEEAGAYLRETTPDAIELAQVKILNVIHGIFDDGYREGMVEGTYD